MDHLTAWGHEHASLQARTTIAERLVDDAFAATRTKLVAAIAQFVGAPLTPSGFHAFERLLWILIRDLGRILLQTVIQALEPEEGSQLPKDLVFEAGCFRRRGDRTRNANVATRFGTIVLWRRGYRSWQRGEETIFPLELLLGLTESVTPALLDLMGKTLAAAGMSQQATLAVLREQCAPTNSQTCGNPNLHAKSHKSNTKCRVNARLSEHTPQHGVYARCATPLR